MAYAVGMLIICPAATPGIDVFADKSIDEWRKKMESEIDKWKADHSHVIVSDIPVTVIHLPDVKPGNAPRCAPPG